MKKIAIGCFAVLVAIFVFFYVQLQQAKTLLNEQLAQQGIIADEADFGFMPKLHFFIAQLTYQDITLKQIEGTLAWLPLLYGDAKLEQVTVNRITLNENARNAAKITFNFSDFSLKQLPAREIHLKGDNLISVKLEKPIYGKNSQFDIRFSKAKISLQPHQESLFQAENVILNKQDLGYLEVHSNFEQPQKVLAAYIKPACMTACLAVLKFNALGQESAVEFSGKNFPMEHLLTILSFPNTMTGTTDFNIRLAFKNAELTQGTFDFNARDGELLGLNLLDMVAQYLPINYNDDLLQGKNMNTAYQTFTSSLSLENNRLNVNKISLKTTALLGEGNGIIDLHKQQCDIKLNLSAVNEKYQRLSLPIRFFDSCYSPQYKLEINQDFRKQLKDLIKEKLK